MWHAADAPRRHVVVLLDADGVWSRPTTRMERLRARLHADSLDERLAAGEAPESDVLLALRAQRLARIDCRRMLARSVARVLADCDRRRRPRRTVEPPSLVAVPKVVAAHRELEQLVESLLAPAPVSARGVAATSCLLRDGNGPLYRYDSADDLGALVRRTIDALDPASDWPS